MTAFIDLVAGGFPCQSHSVAGKRKAGDDERDLWPECARTLRELRPSIAVFENVTGLFTSDGGRFFNGIMSDVSESGYDAEWRVISAADAGAPHERKRVWIVAYTEIKRLYAGEGVCKTENPCKDSGKKPKEWEQFFPFVTGNYTLRYRPCDEPFLTGDDDGLSAGLDRLKCLGNAIVPQCAEMIFNLPAFDGWRV